MVLQRNAGSSSDGTEDSDFSTDLEHTDSSESDGTSRRSARVTRSSARLSQSSQGKGFLLPDQASDPTLTSVHITVLTIVEMGSPSSYSTVGHEKYDFFEHTMTKSLKSSM